MNSELKSILLNVCYAVCWTLALLGVTFPSLFIGEMTLDFHPQTLDEAIHKYFIPFGIAMMLFLLDVIYGYAKERSKGKSPKSPNTIGVITVLLFVTLWFFLFQIFLLQDYPRIACVCFILSWIFMALMKLLNTGCCCIDKDMQPVKVDKVNTD